MANVTKLSGIHFTVHDLRRTLITIAEGLDISAYALKRLRKPRQQITDYFMKVYGYSTFGNPVRNPTVTGSKM